MIESMFVNGFQVWANWILLASLHLVWLTVFIALIVMLCGNSSPQLRYGLWLIVLAKVFVPPVLWFSIDVAPGINESIQLWINSSATLYGSVEDDSLGYFDDDVVTENVKNPYSISSMFMTVWVIGAVVYLAVVMAAYIRLRGRLGRSSVIEEGPMRVALEKRCIAQNVKHSPELVVSEHIVSPCLAGVFRPRIVLPKKIAEMATENDLKAVFAHELIHLQRLDIVVGWLQVLAQALFWFHPLVWWTNQQIKQTREEACDEAVLRIGRVSPDDYASSILRMLISSKPSPWFESGVSGVFEQSTNLQKRLERVMNFNSNKSGFGIRSKLAVVFAAILLLPLAPVLNNDLNGQEKQMEATASELRTPYPNVVKTVPAIGATDVKPGTSMMKIVFDRDMNEGMSVTGDPKWLPEIPKGKKPRWKDKRTLIIPVKFRKGRFYRMGINSKSNQNFQSADGVPVPPQVFYFVTAGADVKTKQMATMPKIVKMEPAAGKKDVDPAIASISVTFNTPMNGDMSWVGGGPTFPTIPNGQRPTWSKDGKTCTMPVQLESAKDYWMSINGPNFNGFQTKAGVPVKPFVYEFSTANNID